VSEKRNEGWRPGALEMFIEDWWDEEIAPANGPCMTIATIARHAKTYPRRAVTAVRNLRRSGFLSWAPGPEGVWLVSRCI